MEDGCEYVKMTDVEDRNYIDASERLLPRSLRDNPVSNYMLTRNWKDDASETAEHSLGKQVTAAALILGYLVCGGSALATGAGPAVGAVSLVYGGAGLVQYLSFKTAPLIRAASVNAVSVIGALLGVGAILTNGLSLTLLLLTTMHLIDLSHAADISASEDLDNMQSAGSRVGPLANFFTISWKANGFHKRHFMTCQTV